MKVIDFSKNNDDEIIYIDKNSFLNIIDLQDKSLEVTSEKFPQHPFDQVVYSFDGKFIIYTLMSQGYHFLKVVPIEMAMINSYLLTSVCSFYTSGDILNFYISPNANRVAIIFSVKDIYFDMIKGKSTVEVKDQNKNFLHVYEFQNGKPCSLIFNKRYTDTFNVALSELDTIAIASIENPSDGSNRIEVYNLNNNKRISNTVVPYPIFHMKFLPETDIYNNNLILVSFNIESEHFYMKIIDLKKKFTIKYNKILNEEHIFSIDISTNLHIALGTNNGLLYFTSFTDEPIRLYNDKMIMHTSFSITGNNIAVVCLTDESEQEEEQEEGQRYVFSVLNIPDNIEIYNSKIADLVYENYFIKNPQVKKDEKDETNLSIRNPFLDKNYSFQEPNQEKLKEHNKHNCFDLSDLTEKNIGSYLSSSQDNLVLFIKVFNKPEFIVTCLNFNSLKIYLKDPSYIFYECIDSLDNTQYSQNKLEYLKLPTQANTIFVNYQDIYDKYKQRQNMIFLEFDKKISRTISFNASYTHDYESSNHCQEGSVIDFYKIIF